MRCEYVKLGCEASDSCRQYISSFEWVTEPSRQLDRAPRALFNTVSEWNRMSVHGRRDDAQIQTYRDAAA